MKTLHCAGNPYHSAYKSTNEDILKW